MSTRRAPGLASMTARCLEPMFPSPTTANFTIPSFFAGMSCPFPHWVVCVEFMSDSLVHAEKIGLVGFPPVLFEETAGFPGPAQPAFDARRSLEDGLTHGINLVRVVVENHLLA